MALQFSHVAFYWLFYTTIAWILAWTGYWVVATLRRGDPGFEPWPWHRRIGLVLVVWPFVKFAYGVYENFSLVLDPDSVAGTVPTAAWWMTIERRAVQYVLMPIIGMWFALGLHQRGRGMRLGERAHNLLVRIAAWPRRSLLRDLANGAWLFVVIYFGYLALSILLAPIRQLDTGDESAVFDGLTPALAFALALTAGVTEELLFRGILQTQLQRLMPLWGAITVQSVFFGLIHSGYGTVGHILFPALFGVVMGLVMLWFGLTPAIIVHAMVDLVIFLSITSGLGYDWTLTLIPIIFVGAIVFPALYFLVVMLRRMGQERTAAPARATEGTAEAPGDTTAAGSPSSVRRNP